MYMYTYIYVDIARHAACHRMAVRQVTQINVYISYIYVYIYMYTYIYIDIARHAASDRCQ